MDTTSIKLTMPEHEAGFLREAYACARVILEYGGGGSTLLAAGMEEKRVFCVESDPDWCARLRRAVDGAKSEVTIHHGDVGPTGEWGRPVSPRQWPKFHTYPVGIWDRPEFEEPDVVLIDGLLRPACFATCAIRITKPTLVLFDDYAGRKAYHAVEAICAPVQKEGRLAIFELIPGLIGPKDLSLVQNLFTQVNYAPAKS
ncbi:hypothetical protein [Falsirhodobacter sp. alg1]|uniref:hypothetical protein n=1 Tax=Falsirhodobacter sp. alg1 TaxID=1472418 RepID=UPI0005EDA26A|nr:hypothetical protein [Falsirhodobacter sp. alg1]